MPAQLIADMGVMWTCASCGVRSFNHHESCDGCCKERPEPPPEKEPSKVPQEETMPGFMLGEGWKLFFAD